MITKVEKKTLFAGISGLFSSLVGGRTLEAVDVAPALDKLRDLLISKNVAAEIAAKLCHSVQAKLVGKVFEKIILKQKTKIIEKKQLKY